MATSTTVMGFAVDIFVLRGLEPENVNHAIHLWFGVIVEV